jgi:hypothetical protein
VAAGFIECQGPLRVTHAGDSLISEEGSELDIEPRHFNAGEVPKADFHSA